MNTAQREKQGNQAIRLGLVANIFLAIIKTTVGILGHSPALLSDGINSTSDVVYYIAVVIFMRLASQPADDEHPYGHSQLESIAALVVGSFIITTAVAIFWDAINKTFELVSGISDFSGAASLALWIALLTVGLKIGLYLFTQKVGRSSGNVAVLALAYDHRNDIFSASSAAIGIFLGRMGFPWVDPLVGALVALLILRTGIEILRQSSNELMDSVPSQVLAVQITNILKNVCGVEQVQEVHAHRFGPYLVVNITIGVEGTLTVADGDDIASRVEKALYDQVDMLQRVYVHYHPSTLTHVKVSTLCQ